MRYILWSGGFDSTYMLCKCARESDETIQPIYVYFPFVMGRGASDKEVQAQENLLPCIKSESGIRAKILRPIRIAESDIKHDSELDIAYERLQNSELLQHNQMYFSLCQLSVQYPGIMIGIEGPTPLRGPVSTTERYLIDYGITVNDDGTLSLSENGNKDVYTLFKSLRFPIIHINTAQELADLREWGYDDLIPLTKTCCTPLPQPCGVCSNCAVKMEYGDLFKTIMPRAYVNYKIKQYISSISTRYAQLFTLFVWGQYKMPSGNVTTIIDGTKQSLYVSKQTQLNCAKWFNALLDNYPNFDKVNRADYGIE